MKKVKTFLKEKHACFMACLVTAWCNTLKCQCDIFDLIETISTNTSSKIVSTVIVLLPLAFLIDLVCIIFTRDQKKLALEYGILASTAIGFIAMLVVYYGDIAETLKGLVGV